MLVNSFLGCPLNPPPPPSLPLDSNENESPSWKQGASTLSYGPYKKESNNDNEHARMQHGANFSIVCTMPLNNKNIIKLCKAACTLLLSFLNTPFQTKSQLSLKSTKSYVRNT